jgi:hypothetical protein
VPNKRFDQVRVIVSVDILVNGLIIWTDDVEDNLVFAFARLEEIFGGPLIGDMSVIRDISLLAFPPGVNTPFGLILLDGVAKFLQQSTRRAGDKPDGHGFPRLWLANG